MHKQFLQQAIDLAHNNVTHHQGGPYGALIVQDGAVIAESANCVTKALDPTAHAEIMAIRLACKTLNHYKLDNCILYSSCEPCPMCLGAIYWARLKKVYYACSSREAAKAGFDDSFIYDEIPLAPENRHIAMLQLTLADAKKPFQAWQIQNNKVIY